MVVLLGATLYVVLPELAGARTSIRDLGHLDIGFVILGVGLEAAALGAYAQLTHTVLPGRRCVARVCCASTCPAWR